MSSNTAGYQADDVGPPIESTAVAAAATDPYGVFVTATTNGAQRFAIPAKWKGRFVDFAAEGLDCWIAFGNSSVTATTTTASTVAAEAITFVAASCTKLPQDQPKGWRIPVTSAVTHFSIRSTGTTGYVRAHCSVNAGINPPA